MPIGTKNTVIQGCGLHHISIQTRDWDASLRLYRDTLGMELVAEFGTPERPIVLLDMGDGSHVELFAPNDNTPAAGGPAANYPIVHFGLATIDTHASIEHIRQSGYRVTSEPKMVELSGMQVIFAFFEGPNGEEIEFFQTHSD